MNRSNTSNLPGLLLFVCRCLNSSPSAVDTNLLRRLMLAKRFEWPHAVGIANNYLVTPALYHTLKQNDLFTHVPSDVRKFLAHIYESNMQRNLLLKDQAVEVIGALNDIGITPLLLKGANTLFEAQSATIGLRVMADIDLLVPDDSLQDVETCLSDLGYVAAVKKALWHKHDQPFIRDGSVAALDMHRSFGQQYSCLSPREALADARLVVGIEGNALFPSPTHQMLHNILHSEVQDRGHLFGRLSLRGLQDFARIQARHKEVIDWNMIRAAVRYFSSRNVLKSYLYAGHRLVGTPIPIGLEPNRRARQHLRKCIMQLRYPLIDRAMAFANRVSAPTKRSYVGYMFRCEHSRMARVYFRFVLVIRAVKR